MSGSKGNIGGEIEIIVQDKNGEIIEYFKKPMRSFTNKASWFFFVCPFGGDDVNGCGHTNTDGASDNFNWSDLVKTHGCGAEGDDTIGIVVGRSDEPFDVGDYNLHDKIPHGDGDNQLHYGAGEQIEMANTYARWQRTFDNNGSVDVVVKEIGFIVAYEAPAGTLHKYLFARDVVSPVTVPAGGRLTVKYKWEVQ